MACEPGHMILVGPAAWAPSEIEVRAGIPDLPVQDGVVDVVVCIEPYASYAPAVRRELVREAKRILRRGGMFAAWVPRCPATADDADFWALEEELAEVFAGSTMMAQIPWQGVSLAPVVDDASVPSVSLEETLLDEVPEASHYLAIAFRDRAPADLHAQLRSQCLLVAVPASEALEEPAMLDARLESLPVEPAVEPVVEPAAEPAVEPVEPAEDPTVELHATIEAQHTDIRVLTQNVEALEQSLARVSERAETRAREAESLQKERRELDEKCAMLTRERDTTALQLEVATAERAGARQLSERVEAELEQSRRRMAEQHTLFAERTAEASRAAGELAAVRERLTHQEAALERTRSQAEELTRTAARQDEQSRMLTEVASDRDRLREELTRRADAIEALEERAWAAREEFQKERLDAVRLASDVERLRDQAKRAHDAEQRGRAQVESLSAELRAVEVAAADAKTLARSRDSEIEQLRADAKALGSDSADLQRVHAELAERGRELGELRAQLEQTQSRTSEATERLKRREEQLSAAGEQLQALRIESEHNDARSAAQTAELEVRTLEIEQLAASVANLQGLVEEQRLRARHSEEGATKLQRRLEQATEELDLNRNQLRSREQELADLVAARETDGVEVYKLRQELEAASHASERFEEAFKLDPESGAAMVPAGSEPGDRVDETAWPDDAVAEARRLRAQLVAQTRRHAEQIARVEAERDGVPTESEALRRAVRAELEADVRAEEQAHLLTLLESAEQRIWEMGDASDRNAARLAASLAQLEKHKEQIDETLDELEVVRNLLATSQARALEQERLVASERHKLVRAGIDPDGLPDVAPDEEDPFADLDVGDMMIELHATQPTPEAGAPVGVVTDRSGSIATGTSKIATAPSSRVLVEAVDDDGWDDGQVEEIPPKDDAASIRARVGPPPRIASVPTPRKSSRDAVRAKGAANSGQPPKK